MPEPEISSPSNTNRVATACGITVISIGLLALTGWIIDFDPLKRVHSSFVAMNPATAVCLILSGTALILRAEPTSRSRMNVSRVIATIVLAAGSAKIFGYITGFPVRLDAMLFQMELREVTLRIPNQMAPNTAASLVLMGLAILLFRVRLGRILVGSIFAFGMAAVGLLGVLGYTYGVTQFSQLSPVLMPMAFHTAVSILLLGSGVLFGSRDFPLPRLFLHPGSARVIVIRLFPAATLFVIGLGWLRLYGEKQGYFPNVMGTASFVVIVVFVMTALVLWTANAVSRAEEVQREAEASLRSSKAVLEGSNQRLELIMNHAADLICSLDRQHGFLTANAAFERTLGYLPGQIPGRSLQELIHPDDTSPALERLQMAQQGATPVSADIRCRRKDGTFLAVAWSFQWSAYHQTMFGVGRTKNELDSLRAWDDSV